MANAIKEMYFHFVLEGFFLTWRRDREQDSMPRKDNTYFLVWTVFLKMHPLSVELSPQKGVLLWMLLGGCF